MYRFQRVDENPQLDGAAISPILVDNLQTQKENYITFDCVNHLVTEDLDEQKEHEILLNETDKNLVDFEMDLYWAVRSGNNPLQLFKDHPGRFKMWHVKDMDKEGAFADVGTGLIDFATIFAHGKQAGLELKIVERDRTDNVVKTLQQGFKAVSALSKS